MGGRIGRARWALVTTLGGLTVGALAGSPAVTRAAQQLQVFVMNTPADPIPMTGAVTVSGTPQVSLGTEVVRTAGPGGATPFQVTGEMSLEPGQDTTIGFVDLPPGKDLVAQFVAVQGFNFDLFSVITNPEGQPLHQYMLPISDRPFLGSAQNIGSEMVQMHLHNPVLAIHRGDTTTSAQAKYLISGYLVDQ